MHVHLVFKRPTAPNSYLLFRQEYFTLFYLHQLLFARLNLFLPIVYINELFSYAQDEILCEHLNKRRSKHPASKGSTMQRVFSTFSPEKSYWIFRTMKNNFEFNLVQSNEERGMLHKTISFTSPRTKQCQIFAIRLKLLLRS